MNRCLFCCTKKKLYFQVNKGNDNFYLSILFIILFIPLSNYIRIICTLIMFKFIFTIYLFTILNWYKLLYLKKNKKKSNLTLSYEN